MIFFNRAAISIFITFLVLSNIAGAQILVKGTVVDSINNPIALANVVLLNQQNRILLAGVVTDKKGMFSVETPHDEDTVILKISYVGFDPFVKSLYASTDLGRIVLKNNVALDEVVVTGQKTIIEQKTDRMVFHVQNAPMLKGGSGVDVLKGVPKVTVLNEKISIIGKNSVRIMINGRLKSFSAEESIAYLESLDTEDIKEIEVITTPPSKYEAGGGNVGMINIILAKKQSDYYTGNVKATYKPATYQLGQLIGSFNFKKNKWTLSATATGTLGSKQMLRHAVIHYPGHPWVRDETIDKKNNYQSWLITAEYNVSKNTFIGLQYDGDLFNYPDRANAYTNIHNAQSGTSDTVITRSENLGKNYSHAINGHFETLLDTLDKQLTVDLDYYTYDNTREQLFTSSRLQRRESRKNAGSSTTNMYSGKIDLTLPYKFAEVEAGAKVFFLSSDNDLKIYDITENASLLDTTGSNAFQYYENIQSVYASASKELSEKWTVKAGLRMEATQRKGYSVTLDSTIQNSYMRLFPTVYVLYEPTKNSYFSFRYGKRIDRPPFDYLNPFKYNRSLYTYDQGNPLLLPLTNDLVSFSYSYKNLLQTQVSYAHYDNIFSQVVILHKDSTQQIIPRNYAQVDLWSIRLFINLDITKFWSVNSFTYVYYVKARAIIPEVRASNEQLTAYMYARNSFVLNKKKTLFATLNFLYSSPAAITLHSRSAYSQLDIGCRALFLKGKIRASVMLNDVLRTNIPTITVYSNGIPTDFRKYNDIRRLYVTVAYRFGNKNIRAKKYKGSNQPERKRAQEK